ncbi:MAG: DUF4446 family protein [Candidatus Shapirobacteria bacterium]|jgi:hypothetical protein
MSLIFSLLTFFNFLALIYVFYLISKKYRSFNQNNPKNTDSSGTIQKLNLLRFNPFDDVGGDQSFILTLLDKDNSGVLLTSLHHRSFTRLYAKPIKHAEGDNITLSKEEKSAILKAINR